NQGAPFPTGDRPLTYEFQHKFSIPQEAIHKACSDFQEISEGIYGNKVYTGYLHDRRSKGPVAVKICDNADSFYAELKIVSRLRHENIIRFIGYCTEEKHKIIVYECVENGSLSTNLHSLTWAQRLKICIGAAKGLKY
ncbi:protein kinase, ATP binding site-containing protein, partial [Tanacetum coccineum]